MSHDFQAAKEDQSSVKLELGMINSAFHGVSVPHTAAQPLLELLQEVWDPLKSILVLWYAFLFILALIKYVQVMHNNTN